jgi:hypothetical protein
MADPDEFLFDEAPPGYPGVTEEEMNSSAFLRGIAGGGERAQRFVARWVEKREGKRRAMAIEAALAEGTI